MKGGKHGRKRRSASGTAPRKSGERGSAHKPGAKRLPTDAPPKGSRSKPLFGGFRTSGDEPV